MKTKQYIRDGAIALAVMAVGLILGLLTSGLLTSGLRPQHGGCPQHSMEERVTTVDTVRHRTPAPQSALTIGTRRVVLPVYRFLGGSRTGQQQCLSRSETGLDGREPWLCLDSMRTDTAVNTACDSLAKDSAVVELPIVQRHYKDSTYEAWVSGPVDPRLDSLRVYAQTTTITRREWKPPKRWHIGVTAGYGYGTKGFQPYVGVGITYSIFSF